MLPVVSVGVKVSRRGGQRGWGGGGSSRRGGGGSMVASQSVVQEPQNDMYCSAVHSPYGEYYPESNPYYVHGAPPEMCPTHICTVHSDYGEHSRTPNIR